MRKIKKPLSLRIGQSSDSVIRSMKRHGVKRLRYSVLNRDQINDASKHDLVVRWFLSNGTKVVFERTRGPENNLPRCYRITQIDMPETPKKARARK